MAAAFDIVVRRARLRGTEALHDIAVAGGRIAAIGERVPGAAPAEIDARGGLATESFVNPHLHLCKVYTLFMTDDEAARAYHGAGMRQALWRSSSPRASRRSTTSAGSSRTCVAPWPSPRATAARTCAPSPMSTARRGSKGSRRSYARARNSRV